MKAYIAAVVSLMLLACQDESPGPALNDTVHMAGFLTTATGAPVVGYWKDGLFSKLVSDSSYSNVNSLFVAGSTTVIGGYHIVPPSEVVVWQNGTKSVVDDAFGSGPLVASNQGNLVAVWFSASLKGWVLHKDQASVKLPNPDEQSWPTDLALLGNDAYISGVAQGQEFSPDTEAYYSDQYAQLWKNDRLAFKESRRSYAWCVFIKDDDVFIGGNLYEIPVGNRTACYWKNGQLTTLTDGSQDAVVSSLTISDGSVYASGTYGGHACYWKDGAMTLLPHGNVRSGGNGISVQDGNVHVAGYDDGHPAYWINGEKQTFQHHNMRGEIRFITVGSD